MGTLITLALFALLDTIISLMLNGAMWIATQIMDSSITTFSAGDNIIVSFMKLLPFSYQSSVNVSGIIYGVSYGVLFICLCTSLFEYFTAPLTGKDTESISNVLFRFLLAVLFKVLLFGTSINFNNWYYGGLLGTIGKWFTLILSKVEIPDSVAFAVDSITLNVAAYIGVLVLLATLLASVLGAAISYIERIISFALTILIGPVAISLYANRKTEDYAIQWLISIFTQFGAILLNLLLWAAFITQMNYISNDIAGGFFTSENKLLIFNLAIAVVLLSLIKNCEKILNSFGLRTMPSLDSVRSLTSGSALLGSGAMFAGRTWHSIGGAVNNFMGRYMHSSGPATGGKANVYNAGMKAAQLNNRPENLYSKNDSLSSGSQSNSIRKAAYAMGLTNSYGMPSRQVQAINALNACTQELKQSGDIAGRKLETPSGGTGEKISGADMLNAALGLDKSGSGYKYNGDITYASSKDSSGNPVLGVTGNMVYESPTTGAVVSKGTYFTAIENGGSAHKLSSGTPIDAGSDNKLSIGENSLRLDNSGGFAYQVNDKVTNKSFIQEAPAVYQETSPHRDLANNIMAASNGKEDDVITEVFGDSNITDNDQFDPSIDGIFGETEE